MTNRIVVTAAAVLALVAMSLGAKAQMFLTGQMGFGYKTTGTTTTVDGKSTDVNGPSTFNMALVPGIGAAVTNQLDLGLNMGYEFERSSETKEVGGKESVTASNTHGFVMKPYFVFHLVQFGDLTLGLEGSVNLGYAAGSTSVTFDGKTETADNPSKLRLGTYLTPELIYRVSNHFALTATFDLFRVGWTMNRTTKEDKANKTTTVDKSHQFDMGFNANKTALTVGVRYML